MHIVRTKQQLIDEVVASGVDLSAAHAEAHIHAAAVRIQVVLRSYAARGASRTAAATRIQAHWRASMALVEASRRRKDASADAAAHHAKLREDMKKKLFLCALLLPCT